MPAMGALPEESIRYFERRKKFTRTYETPLERMALVCILASIWGLRIGFETIGALHLASVAFSIGAIPAFVWALKVGRENVEYLSGLTGPNRRIATYACTAACAVGMMTTNAALFANRYIATSDERSYCASVVRTGRVVGPKVWGWDADIKLPDNRTHYMMVTQDAYISLTSSPFINVTVKKGALGFDNIIGISRPQCA